jgi:hypothetical protein
VLHEMLAANHCRTCQQHSITVQQQEQCVSDNRGRHRELH